MLKQERLQILVTTEQRQRLEGEAKRRGSSVATIVREAIDRHVGAPTHEDRRRALDAITAMHGRYLPPDEIEALIEEERDRAAGAA